MNKAPEAFRTISEVAEDLALPQHVLRFWESRFPQVRPMKRGGGRRYYRPDDVDLLRGIRHLLYGEGYTIRGVQRILREQGGRFVQTVWQEGAPQPERRPELDVVDGDSEEAIEAVALAEAEEAESPPAGPGPSGPAFEPDLDTDPYGRREPSFGPPPGPLRAAAPVPATAATPAAHAQGHGPSASAPPPSFGAPPFKSPPFVAPPFGAPPFGAPSVGAAPVGGPSFEGLPAGGEAADPPSRAPIAIDRAEPVPLPPPRLSDDDRETLSAVLAELEACRGLLAEARAPS